MTSTSMIVQDVDALQFSIMGPDEIRERSVVEVTKNETYEKSVLKPCCIMLNKVSFTLSEVGLVMKALEPLNFSLFVKIFEPFNFPLRILI